MAERIEGSRNELQHPEGAVDGKGCLANEQPGDDQHQQQRQNEADARRHDDGAGRLQQALPDDGTETGLGQAGADETADERVRGTRWDAEDPGNDVPGDGAHQRREDHLRRDDTRIDDAGSERFGDVQPEEEEGDEVEERRPEDRILRPEHAGRYDGCDGIGRVVQPVEEVEEKRDGDEPHEQREGERRIHQTFSITMPLISFATSSKRSTTFSSSP